MVSSKSIILQKGAPVLEEKAAELKIKEVQSPRIRKTIERMKQILKAAENGVGLAAPQIGIPLRIFIVSEEVFLKDGSAENPEAIRKRRERSWNPLVFINPKLAKASAKKNLLAEGCLSVEKVYGKVKRSEKVFFEAYNEKGEKIKRGASGLFAQVIQHEIDHLDGILFVEKAVEIKNESK